ncbi:DUF1178 family protein [Sulfitobacter sp. HNIBRBA3233]|uniref:DUF1178 family protein n=1 Tax=Sulfitobacter marinivivus TaxID=3158558 RepID=UPI0032DEB27C
MIRYALRCDDGHEFESWFQSAAAFDALAKAGHLSCGVCGSGAVRKALMAPNVVEKAAPAKPPRTAEQDPAVRLAELRREIEAKATYVGGSFAERAREMHEGRSPEKPIYGETTPAEARALLDDGVPVAPLPFKPRQKMQ